MILLSEKWQREVYFSDEQDIMACNLTFCGVIEKLFKEISYTWKSKDTIKQNLSSFDNVILPALEGHDSKRICDYSYEDYIEAINRIRQKGYINNQGIKYLYAESTMRSFENLIYIVVFRASVYGYCNNVLWGSSFEIQVPTVERKIEEKTRLKKSLSVKEDHRLAKRLLDDPCMPGEEVGVLLMYSLGTRNGEACGLNYGDITTLDSYPDDHVVWIYKSTIPNTSILQSSGKTWNSGRIVPLPVKVYKLLQERKEKIKQYLISIGESVDIIDTLPIACVGRFDQEGNYNKRSSARHLTGAAKSIFQEIGLEPRTLAYIEAEVSENDLEHVINEKDPTAYLLRRNYATHLAILGFSNAEIQYLIGHDVEDAYEVRNEFVDDDRLHLMYEKLLQRPLLNDMDDNNTVTLTIGPLEEVRVGVVGKEPGDDIHISVRKLGSDISAISYSGHHAPKYDRTINIMAEYHRQYK